MSKYVKKIVYLALLVALGVVLYGYCTIKTEVLKIGFTFLAIALAAILYGPLWGGVVGALIDVICCFLFPIGAYFPGFTLTAFLTGVVYGVFLYKRPERWLNLLFAVLIVTVFLDLGMNTYWLALTSGGKSTFMGLFWFRWWGKLLITGPIQFLLIWAIGAKSPIRKLLQIEQ